MIILSNRRETIITTKRALSLLAISFALFYLLTVPTSSLKMTNRSVVISTAVPDAAVDNFFSFDIPSTTVIGSIVFEYCDNSPLHLLICNAPPGFNALGASVASQTLNTGFTEDIPNSTANRLVLSRAATAGVIGPSSYSIEGLINPSAINSTVFIRISSHASVDGTGANIDIGSLAYSTAQSNFNVGAFVPPYLTFCTGQFVSADCSTATGALASFGELSELNTSAVTTQMAAATNDFDGYNIFLSGQTLTSGNNVIDPLSIQTGSSAGVAQFGLNLRQNTSPSVGAEISGIGTATPAASYNTQNQYRFSNGDLLASSSTSTDFNRYTLSYVANVIDSQAPGVYATTLTYMAVASF
jgi:hypothetical protein